MSSHQHYDCAGLHISGHTKGDAIYTTTMNFPVFSFLTSS